MKRYFSTAITYRQHSIYLPAITQIYRLLRPVPPKYLHMFASVCLCLQKVTFGRLTMCRDVQRSTTCGIGVVCGESGTWAEFLVALLKSVCLFATNSSQLTPRVPKGREGDDHSPPLCTSLQITTALYKFNSLCNNAVSVYQRRRKKRWDTLQIGDMHVHKAFCSCTVYVECTVVWANVWCHTFLPLATARWLFKQISTLINDYSLPDKRLWFRTCIGVMSRLAGTHMTQQTHADCNWQWVMASVGEKERQRAARVADTWCTRCTLQPTLAVTFIILISLAIPFDRYLSWFVIWRKALESQHWRWQVQLYKSCCIFDNSPEIVWQSATIWQIGSDVRRLRTTVQRCAFSVVQVMSNMPLHKRGRISGEKIEKIAKATIL